MLAIYDRARKQHPRGDLSETHDSGSCVPCAGRTSTSPGG
jgi:hypothetical protein